MVPYTERVPRYTLKKTKEQQWCSRLPWGTERVCKHKGAPTRTHTHVALGVQRGPEGSGKNSCLREGNSVRENETYFPLQALSCLLNSVPYAYTIYSNYRIIKKLRGLQS